MICECKVIIHLTHPFHHSTILFPFCSMHFKTHARHYFHHLILTHYYISSFPQHFCLLLWCISHPYFLFMTNFTAHPLAHLTSLSRISPPYSRQRKVPKYSNTINFCSYPVDDYQAYVLPLYPLKCWLFSSS